MVKGTNDMRTNSNVHVQILKMKFKKSLKNGMMIQMLLEP